MRWALDAPTRGLVRLRDCCPKPDVGDQYRTLPVEGEDWTLVDRTL